MKRILFIDRDGTIIREPADEQVDDFGKLAFLPGAITTLARIAREMDYVLLMVTNQDGLGTAAFPEETFWPVQHLVLDILGSEGVEFAEICIDRTTPAEHAPTRKPGTGMLTRYLHGNYDLAQSFVIGDRESDIQLAKNIGCHAIHLAPPESVFKSDAFSSDPGVHTCASWAEIYQLLKGYTRRAQVFRKTSETTIAIDLNLNGSGHAAVNTGIAFFDHMLTQLAKHGGIDLTIRAEGDLAVDEHHTIEDTALALGQAFDQALGMRKGLMRYGFVLPMDDCLAQVAVDFGGRPWTVWEATFSRERIGGMPTEMFSHFFKSFSDTARCNLNIKAEGQNEHHKIESIFKAWARAIRMALAQDAEGHIPSTKGTL